MNIDIEIYNRDLKGIIEAYSKSKSWEDVITSGYFNSDEYSSMGAFIDFIEDVYKIKIKDANQLDKLTGLTTLLSKEPNIKKGKEPTLEYILTSSRYSKYFNTLEKALNEGAKYKDLLQIKPQDYGLPKTWSGCLGSDQYSSILWALSFEFLINEPASLMLLPDLRSIAQEVEATYSVLMDCYNLTNKGKEIKNIKNIKREKEEEIINRLPLLMDEIGDKYYKYFIKDEIINPKDFKEIKEDILQELKYEFKITLSLLLINNIKKEDKIELDELQSLIALDIVKYFSKELIELKTLFYGANRN